MEQIRDPLFDKIIHSDDIQQCTIRYLQDRYSIGYNRASRIISQMEEAGIINDNSFAIAQKEAIEQEKEAIKADILAKRRRRELKKIALEELREEGIIENVRKREPIPQDVQDAVWIRDGGRCVKCGSRENLEFDHIIPFSKGGSNTVRNLQLLCSKCNKEKSNHIGNE